MLSAIQVLHILIKTTVSGKKLSEAYESSMTFLKKCVWNPDLVKMAGDPLTEFKKII